jgi:palmitoyl-protein thioesterase
VVPRDSAWFSFFNGTDLIPLKDQPLYQQDWIGLRQLDEAGKLLMEEAPGEHMQLTLKWFDQEVVRKYLAPPVTPSQRRCRSSAAAAGANAQRQVVA